MISKTSTNTRNCLPCTACCDGWLSSKHIDMSPGHSCQHRTASGCAIYTNRPSDPCRTFQCAWVRNGSKLADELRPDLCGAILMENRSYLGWNVMIATPTGWKIPQPTLEKIMRYARQIKTPLIYIENFHKDGSYTHFSRSGYGPGPFVDAITQKAGQPGSRDVLDTD